MVAVAASDTESANECLRLHYELRVTSEMQYNDDSDAGRHGL
jgi:hypothetical protein